MGGQTASPVRIVVTGAAGFIGRALVAEAIRRHHDVVAVLRPGAPPPPFQGRIPLFERDIAACPSWEEVLAGADVVVHLADGLGLFEGLATPAPAAMEQALARSVHLAEAAGHAGVRSFIYLSSIKALSGETADGIVTDDSPPDPHRGAYGQMKARLEEDLARICAGRGVRFVGLRPPLVYGRGVGGNFGRLLALAHGPWPLPLAGFDAPRSLIARSNLCDAILVAATCKSGPAGSWLVHDGPPLSVRELVALIREIRGRPPRLVPFPGLRFLQGVEKFRPVFDRLNKPLVLSDAAFRAAFSWAPPLTTRQALRQMLER